MNMDQFSIAVMESLMTLEREEYLKGVEWKVGFATGPLASPEKHWKKTSR